MAASSPLSETFDGMRRLEEAGASAIVMSSLFEEQITHEGRALEHYMSYGAESYSEAVSYFPDQADFHIGPEQVSGIDPESPYFTGNSDHCQPQWSFSRRVD